MAAPVDGGGWKRREGEQQHKQDGTSSRLGTHTGMSRLWASVEESSDCECCQTQVVRITSRCLQEVAPIDNARFGTKKKKKVWEDKRINGV